MQDSLEPSPQPSAFPSGGADIRCRPFNLASALSCHSRLYLDDLFRLLLKLLPLARSGTRFDCDHKSGPSLHRLGRGRLGFMLRKLELDGASRAAGFGSTGCLRSSLTLGLGFCRVTLGLVRATLPKYSMRLWAREKASRGRLSTRGLCKVIGCL